MPLKIALAFCALVLASPAMAAPFVDDGSGLALTVPDNFSATALDPALEDGIVVVLNSDEVNDYGEERYECTISVTYPPKASTLSQAQISAAMVSPERQASLPKTMSAAYKTKSQTVFHNDGVSGTEFIRRLADTRDDPPYVYITMMETPSGRTTMACSVVPEELDVALPIYRQIRDSMVAARR